MTCKSEHTGHPEKHKNHIQTPVLYVCDAAVNQTATSSGSLMLLFLHSDALQAGSERVHVAVLCCFTALTQTHLHEQMFKIFWCKQRRETMSTETSTVGGIQGYLLKLHSSLEDTVSTNVAIVCHDIIGDLGQECMITKNENELGKNFFMQKSSWYIYTICIYSVFIHYFHACTWKFCTFTIILQFYPFQHGFLGQVHRSRYQLNVTCYLWTWNVCLKYNIFDLIFILGVLIC